MVLKITPGKPGTSKQSQGTAPKSRRAVWEACGAPAAIRNTFIMYPARSGYAARVLFSTNQAKQQKISFRGGYLSNRPEVAPFLQQSGSRCVTTGTQSII